MTTPAGCHCQQQFWLTVQLFQQQDAKLDKIIKILGAIMTEQQADIDTVTGEIQAETADAATRDAAILAAQQAFSAELAAVAGQGVSTTALVTAAQAMLTAQGVDDATVAALAAAANAPAPDPAPVAAPAEAADPAPVADPAPAG